jgi:hypothetical protein
LNIPLKIGNFSGYEADRETALREVLTGSPVDVAFGDYLAEITMASLVTRLEKDASRGYVAKFFEQFKDAFDLIVDSGTRIVTNAGGFKPKALAEDIVAFAEERGVPLKVAYVTGDNLLDDFQQLLTQGHEFKNMESGRVITAKSAHSPLSVNAYLGGWGVAKALAEGAQVVVTGRVADASLAVGSAAWFHGWRMDEWDKLAGALAAAHIIECGPQAVGGNYSGFTEITDNRPYSFPVAEIYEDGSTIITKHPGQGGMVTVDTVTAQLLYEIQGPHYLNNDVTLDVRSVSVVQEGADRVRVHGAKGFPPPTTTKVSIFKKIGYQSVSTAYVTAPNVDEKVRFIERQLAEFFPPDSVRFAVTRIGAPAEHPSDQWEATVVLRVITTADDQDTLETYNVGQFLTSLYLSGVPGYYRDEISGDARSEVTPRIDYWPGLLEQSLLKHRASIIGGPDFEIGVPPCEPFTGQPPQDVAVAPVYGPATDLRTVALEEVAYARSGDKGGISNVGLWVKDPKNYDWLREALSTEEIRAQVPEIKGIDVERHEFPNLNAVHFLLKGLLGTGGSSSLRLDRVGKAVGEYFRLIIRLQIPRGHAG